MKTIEKQEILKRNYCKLHSLSPYIGKIRPELGSRLIKKYASKDKESYIFDPFCGSGTIPLEGWLHGYNVLGSDLNFYAVVLSLGKLNPPSSIDKAIKKLNQYHEDAILYSKSKIFDYDPWVSEFFHPETLKELIIWFELLRKNNEWFFLSCLMGILHHQRPGFLSYPCSHGVPYLRDKKFPKNEYPEMYDYRSVYQKLKKKVERTLKEHPHVDFLKERFIKHRSASSPNLKIKKIDTIITSPPYMKSLTYARDNRLRLWFLDIEDWQNLDKTISPSKDRFEKLMNECFKSWSRLQVKGNKCIIIIGDIFFDKKKNQKLSDLLAQIGKQFAYRLSESYNDEIPEKNKFQKNKSSIKAENICVFEKG